MNNENKFPQKTTPSTILKLASSDTIILTVFSIVLFLTGRIYFEAYFATFEIPTSLIEWSWNDTLIQGGVQIFSDIIIMILVLSALWIFRPIIVELIDNKLHESSKINNSGIIPIIKIALHCIPLCVLACSFFIMLKAGDTGRADAGKYLKNPRIAKYSTKTNPKAIKRDAILYQAHSGIVYLKDLDSNDIIRLAADDFHSFRILSTKDHTTREKLIA